MIMKIFKLCSFILFYFVFRAALTDTAPKNTNPELIMSNGKVFCSKPGKWVLEKSFTNNHFC